MEIHPKTAHCNFWFYYNGYNSVLRSTSAIKITKQDVGVCGVVT
jgi:hypothetical protein